MNAILSLFLSIAMLFTGSALPAAVDTASILKVQDVVIGYNNESYPLGFDFVLAAAAAQNELRLHFEVEGEENEVLLPLSGRVTPDSVTFSIDDEGSAYTVTAETLNQMMGLEEGDISSVETVVSEIKDYITALADIQEKQSAPVSPELEAAVMDVVYANMKDMTREEAQWDFGRGEIPSTHVNGTISGADLFAILDGWLALGDETLSPILSAVLDLYSTMMVNYAVIDEVQTVVEVSDTASIGVIGGADGPTAVYVAGGENEYAPAESFTQLLQMAAADDEEFMAELESVSAEMDIITGEDEEGKHQIVNLFMIMDEENESAMNISAEANTGAEESDSYFAIYLEQGESSTSYEVQTTIEGPVENPSAVNVNVSVQNDSAQDYTNYEAEEVEEDITYSSTSMYLSAGTIYAEGLEDSDIYMEINESSSRYVDGELAEESEDENISISIYMDEEWFDEGDLVTEYDFNVVANSEENLSLTFTTVLSKAPAVDYFAGMNAVELPADGEDPAYESLGNDALALMNDLMAISNNQEFAALTAAFGGTDISDADYEEEYSDEEYYDEEYYDEEYFEEEYYDEEYYEDEYALEDEAYAEEDYSAEEYAGEDYGEEQFASLEEAAAAYPDKFVSYTAPEGFQLESVSVSGAGEYLYAEYLSEDGRYISLNQSVYQDDGGMDYFSVGAGEAAMVGENIATVYKTDAGYYYAQFYTEKGSLSIYFDDCDAAGVQAILAGLTF